MIYICRDFPNGLVAEIPHSPSRGAWVRSLARELDPIHCNQELTRELKLPVGCDQNVAQPNKYTSKKSHL